MLAAATKESRRQNLRALVLNADGQPLMTWPQALVPARDAVEMVVKDHVSVIEHWDAYFRSPSIQIQVPKVVMLREYQAVMSMPKFCRRNVLLRDRFCCQYCGQRFPSDELTFEHVFPKSRGGATNWTNILMACIPCNAKKAATLANYSGRKGVVGNDGSMRPLKQPKRPTAMELMRAGFEMMPDDDRADFGSWLYWNVELQA